MANQAPRSVPASSVSGSTGIPAFVGMPRPRQCGPMAHHPWMIATSPHVLDLLHHQDADHSVTLVPCRESAIQLDPWLRLQTEPTLLHPGRRARGRIRSLYWGSALSAPRRLLLQQVNRDGRRPRLAPYLTRSSARQPDATRVSNHGPLSQRALPLPLWPCTPRLAVKPRHH